MKDHVLDNEGAPVNVHVLAAQAGFQCPLTITKAAWDDCVRWDSGDTTDASQSEAGRLWDVLSMAFLAHVVATGEGDVRRAFEVLRVPRGGDDAKPVTLIWNLSQHQGVQSVVITDAFDE